MTNSLVSAYFPIHQLPYCWSCNLLCIWISSRLSCHNEYIIVRWSGREHTCTLRFVISVWFQFDFSTETKKKSRLLGRLETSVAHVFLNRQLYWRCTLYHVIDVRLPFVNFGEHSLIIGQIKEVTKSASVLLIRTSPASFQRHFSSFFCVYFSPSFIVYLHFVIELRVCFCKIFSQIIFNENFFFHE